MSERLKELAKARRRFGYRRLHVFLQCEGHYEPRWVCRKLIDVSYAARDVVSSAA